MSEKKYQLMYDPTPAGWRYGFPKAIPDEGVVGEGINLSVKPDFAFDKWVVEQGYPEELNRYGRLWVEEVENESAEKMGDLKFTTAGDFVYPGSDPQV